MEIIKGNKTTEQGHPGYTRVPYENMEIHRLNELNETPMQRGVVYDLPRRWVKRLIKR